MERIKFGTDGWRAVISKDFTFENVKIVSQAIADYLKSIKDKINNINSEFYSKKYCVIVGYDTRFLSEEYAEIVSSVLTANGIRVMLVNRPTPTPSVSFNIKKRNFIGGVMITASHNPARYNGIKFKGHFGGSVTDDVTDAIESKLYKTKPKLLDIKKAIKNGLLKIEDIIPYHLKAVKKYVNLKILKNTRIKLLVDSMNGTGADYIEMLLKGTRIKVTTLNANRDPYFSGRSPEPNEKYLMNTSKIVKKEGFDLGLATDGDADRLGVILPDGRVLSGHKVMTLLLLHLLEDRKLRGGIVQTICGTGLIDNIASFYKLKTYETPVGFKYIAGIMNKEDILIGGEETGGVAFKGWIPERDGLLSGLLILEMMTYRKTTLSDILKETEKRYGRFIYKRLDLNLSLQKKKLLLEKLRRKPFGDILDKKILNVKTSDGFKFIRSDGSWLMLRPSGTEPKIRVYSEAHSEKEAHRLIEFGKKFVLTL